MPNGNRLIATREYKSFLERYIKELYEVDAPMIAGAVERCLYKLEGQPTVDAVPVVRCHECQRSYKSSGSSTGYRCKAWGVYDQDCDCDPNGFCHKGERRCDNA